MKKKALETTTKGKMTTTGKMTQTTTKKTVGRKAVKKASRAPVSASGPAKPSPSPKKAPKKPRAVPEDPTPWLADTPEGRIVRAVDKSGLSFEAFLERGHKPRGLKLSDLTPENIARAKALERTWDAHSRQRVFKLGGRWNGRREGV